MLTTKTPTTSRRPVPPANLVCCAAGLTACALALLTLTTGGCAKSDAPGGRGDQSQPLTADQVAAAPLRNAEAAIASGDRMRARAELMRVIETNPQQAEAQLLLGELLFDEGNYDAAEPRFRQAASAAPQNFRAQFMHGLTLHALGKLQDAVNAYLRALNISPTDFDANVNVASAYFALGEFGQALPYAQQSVRLTPRNGQARYNLGATFAALDRHEEAVVEFQQATELVTITPALLLTMSESMLKTRRFAEAKAALERVVAEAPSALGFERLGSANFRLGDGAAASQAFERAIAIDADYYPALNGIGVCELNRWLDSGQSDDAARQRGLGALRRSLQLKRGQSRVEDLLTRYR